MADAAFTYRPPAELDPFAALIEHGLSDERYLELSPKRLQAMEADFKAHTQNRPWIPAWSPADRSFAQQVARCYFEAFDLQDHLYLTLHQRKRQTPACLSQDNHWRQLEALEDVHTDAEQDITSINEILTSSISRAAVAHMTEIGVGDKVYDEATAIKFLGCIIQASLAAYSGHRDLAILMCGDSAPACAVAPQAWGVKGFRGSDMPAGRALLEMAPDLAAQGWRERLAARERELMDEPCPPSPSR